MLWHSGEVNRTPHFVPWFQLWQENHIMLTRCWYAHRGGSHCKTVMGHTLEETTVTGGVVVVVAMVT